MNKKEVISFRKVIAANTKETLSERVKTDGTIEGIRVRFYQGQEKSLRIRPYVDHKNHKYEDMITFPTGTDPYLSGEDDYNVLPVTLSVEYDDEIKIEVVNASTMYAYTLSVDVIIDYYMGTARVIGGVIE